MLPFLMAICSRTTKTISARWFRKSFVLVNGHWSVVLDQRYKLFELILKYIGSVESHNVNDLVAILKRF